jgi:hypothetical protein
LQVAINDLKDVWVLFWESPKEKDNLEDQDVDGSMGTKWTFERLAEGCGVDSAGSG